MREAPPAALLIEAFVNTVDVEQGTDDLSGPAELAAWFREHGLPAGDPAPGAEDHRLALALRAGLREELGVHVGDSADPRFVEAAEAALAALPLRAVLRPGDTGAALVPDPGEPPARRALGALAAAWSELAVTGEAARLKRCAEHGCAWVFWDTSKNRSRRWCSMRVCGNRAKARRYAARQAAGALD
ncbi:CGNR zinc finger domain-containing protein [Streptomyces mobaraensis]|uniref:CGNR zinc finger domain-containing protein n=1 Tax=Streptomyces mobaraensis TaxID=35621 RepID=A0A5N5W723_STRMB|nr:CGNR zinc finger domain-containing protein [Streptomyces mobaraensis]KAB7843778.1 CGNR zinc finger domain-containing protein [Streptomyces mobaraensis]